jgi:2-C-methyl-D-erythritol 4-phosphate cytidylyltransferase/2-C-methyl-D-erythritol 2,4-cyclodiphosphate synthase
VQTPQVVNGERYRLALEHLNGKSVTDDCMVMENDGCPVRLTPGDYANRKITTPEDLPAEKENTMKLPPIRIGHGYDVHRLVEGRRLILGGCDIPFEKGLLGHSDADVLAHAISDALLGAVALGDIGKHFPDTDPAYAGADSLRLLALVCEKVRAEGWQPVNVDATILCQRPKLAPHILQMRENLAQAMGVETGAVSVKATTEEKLGFTGAGEGIAVHSVALLAKTADE